MDIETEGTTILITPQLFISLAAPAPYRVLTQKHDKIYSLLLYCNVYITRTHRYERLLRRAKTEDLSEVSGIGCLYQSGVDRLGRPVVVFCGKWFPAHNIDLEKVSA